MDRLLRNSFSFWMGQVFFLALVAHLLLAVVNDHLLNADFYLQHLASTNAYARLRDVALQELVLDQLPEEEFPLPREEIVKVAQRAITPEYLQAQAESVARPFMAWLTSETETLEAVVDLRPIKLNLQSEALAFVEGQVDALPSCAPGEMPDLEALQQGTIPNCIPQGIDRQALKTMARPQLEMYVSQALAQFPEEVRLPQQVLEQSGQSSEDILAPFQPARDAIKQVRTLAPTVAFAAMVLAPFLLVLVHFPRVSVGLRWVGLIMLVSGGLVYGLVWAGAPYLPLKLDEFLRRQGEVPASVLTLALEISRSVFDQVAQTVLKPAATVAFTGAGLLALSLVFPLVAARRPRLHLTAGARHQPASAQSRR